MSRFSQRSRGFHKDLAVLTKISQFSQRSRGFQKDLAVFTMMSRFSQRSRGFHKDLAVLTKIWRLAYVPTVKIEKWILKMHIKGEPLPRAHSTLRHRAEHFALKKLLLYKLHIDQTHSSRGIQHKVQSVFTHCTVADNHTQTSSTDLMDVPATTSAAFTEG